MCKTESQLVTLTFDVTGHEELRLLGSDAASNAEYLLGFRKRMVAVSSG